MKTCAPCLVLSSVETYIYKVYTVVETANTVLHWKSSCTKNLNQSVENKLNLHICFNSELNMLIHNEYLFLFVLALVGLLITIKKTSSLKTLILKCCVGFIQRWQMGWWDLGICVEFCSL